MVERVFDILFLLTLFAPPAAIAIGLLAISVRRHPHRATNELAHAHV